MKKQTHYNTEKLHSHIGRFSQTHPTTTEHAQMILQFAWEMKKHGYADTTIESTVRRLKNLSRNIDITQPEQVKMFLANIQWKPSTKRTVVKTYNGFLMFLGKEWLQPLYKSEPEIPFIPTEEELDCLITSTGIKMSTLLQFLKDTGARISEAKLLKWEDIDLQRKTVNIHATKHSNNRILPINHTLIALFNKLTPKNNPVFKGTTHTLRNNLINLRNRIAERYDNPRYKRIHFHTFRHWKGTTEYHKTHDIMHVKQVLGHKSINSTMIYINLENAIFQNIDEHFISVIAHTEEEELRLVNEGWTLVREREGYPIYKKRK